MKVILLMLVGIKNFDFLFLKETSYVNYLYFNLKNNSIYL